MFRKSGDAILFCLSMYILSNVIVFFMVIEYVRFGYGSGPSNNAEIIGWIGGLWLLASIIILLKAIITREKFDRKLKLSAGFIAAILLFILVLSFV